MEYLEIEGYPLEGDPEFNNYLIYTTFSPILRNFISITGLDCIQLRSEKEIASDGGEIGGQEIFVTVDLILVGGRVYSYHRSKEKFCWKGD